MSEPQEVADLLDGLDAPTPDEVYTAVESWGTRDVLAAVGSVAANASGGGGSGSGNVRWLGPCKLNTFGGQYVSNGGGDVDGGTFTFSHDGATTVPIAWDASEAALLAALETVFGVGNVRIDIWNDANQDVQIVFNELAATELMTIDTSGLTGPSAPYSGYSVIAAEAWVSFPLLTVAVGDIIEDFLHDTREAFDTGDERLYYTDNLTEPVGANPVWAMPTSAQGLDGLNMPTPGEYTNFGGSPSIEPNNKPTALTAMVAQWAVSAVNGDDPPNTYLNLPAVALNAVPVYAYFKHIDPAPTVGEVWVWTKVSTPSEMD